MPIMEVKHVHTYVIFNKRNLSPYPYLLYNYVIIIADGMVVECKACGV
jgi:hypothetical protein